MIENSESIPGLTSAEAEARYSAGQSNSLFEPSFGPARRFLREALFSVYNFDLLGIGLAFWLLGEPGQVVTTMVILLLNISVSALLGYRSWKRIESLLALTETQASVLRDARIQVVDPDLIVPGDAVVVVPGDQFYVDGRLLANSRVRVDDYLINGSDHFVELETGDVVFAGSYCVTGHGIYEVTAVGPDRRWTGVAPDHLAGKQQQTPLQKLINKILTILRILVFILITLVLVRYFFAPEVSEEAYDIYINATSIIFSIAPTGLLLMILVAYAAGAAKSAALGAVVKRPQTIEVLAQADVLCLGKTGTLGGSEADLQPALAETEEAGYTDTRLRQAVGSFARSTATMTPLIQVLANSFDGARFDVQREVSLLTVYGWQALSLDDPAMRGTFVLGFNPFVEPLLDPQYPLLPAAEQSPTTLLFAYSPALLPEPRRGREQAPGNLIPLAYINLSETVTADAVATTAAFLEAGIGVKILSSASVTAVSAAAQQVGLAPADGPAVATLTGRDLRDTEPAALYQRIRETDVYARLAPHQKAVVVETLRENGVEVAMIGETVMEVPAMRAADIGISMRAGSQAALAEADIVLLDNSVGMLPSVLELGQGVFNRVLDALKLSLTHTLLVCWLAAIALFAGPAYFPYARAQSLTIVVFTIMLPSLALSYWLVAGKVNARNLTRRLLVFIFPASLTLVALTLAVFLFFQQESSASYARTAVAHTLVLSGLVLIIFVQPPNAFWAGGDNISGDWRPVQLVVVLYLVFMVLVQDTVWRAGRLNISPLRSFEDFLTIWLMTGVWVLVLRWVWRSTILRRASRFSLRATGRKLVDRTARK